MSAGVCHRPVVAVGSDDVELLKHTSALFEQYRQALELAGVPIDSFQSFKEEIVTLPGKYCPSKNGGLLLALAPSEGGDQVPVACIALRDLGDGVAEVKRLYVLPAYRGQGIAKTLSEAIIEVAKTTMAADGVTPLYHRLVLDTLHRLEGAISLYGSLGFSTCEAYCDNPMPDVVYMAMRLR